MAGLHSRNGSQYALREIKLALSAALDPSDNDADEETPWLRCR